MKSSVSHLSNLIMEAFPEADKTKPKPNLDYLCMDMSWYSNDDKLRKHKKTKTFRIIISQEQIEDYENLNTREKEQYDRKLSEFIANKRRQMEPIHNNPSSVGPPIEEWHVEL